MKVKRLLLNIHKAALILLWIWDNIMSLCKPLGISRNEKEMLDVLCILYKRRKSLINSCDSPGMLLKITLQAHKILSWKDLLLYLIYTVISACSLLCRPPVWRERGWLCPEARLLGTSLSEWRTVCGWCGPLHVLLPPRICWRTLWGGSQRMPIWALPLPRKPRLCAAGQRLPVSLSPWIHWYIQISCSQRQTLLVFFCTRLVVNTAFVVLCNFPFSLALFRQVVTASPWWICVCLSRATTVVSALWTWAQYMATSAPVYL